MMNWPPSADSVRALVDHDEPVLREAAAYDHGDPYEFTRRWRLWVHVVLSSACQSSADDCATGSVLSIQAEWTIIWFHAVSVPNASVIP
jgi:hypothetical protein